MFKLKNIKKKIVSQETHFTKVGKMMVDELVIERTGQTTFAIVQGDSRHEFDASGLESHNSKRFELEQRKTEALETIAKLTHKEKVDYLCKGMDPNEVINKEDVRRIIREEMDLKELTAKVKVGDKTTIDPGDYIVTLNSKGDLTITNIPD